MKILDQTRSRGRHAVELMAEAKPDVAVLHRIFEVFRQSKIVSVRAVLEQTASENFPSLRIEESEP